MAMIFGTSLYAKDFSVSERIIGLEIGGAQIQADTIDERDHDGNDVEYGIRLGAQMNEWRTLLILNYFDSSDDDQNYEKGMITFDYMFLNEQGYEQPLQPYIGLNVGYMNYESSYIDEDGYLFGGQVGFAYKIQDSFGIDVSYRYSVTNASKTDHIQSIVVGFNYLY
jgi:long-subunit fatty acid transport protein